MCVLYIGGEINVAQYVMATNHLVVCLYVHPSVCLLSHCLPACLCPFLSIFLLWLPVYLPVCMSFCLCVSVCLFVFLPACLSVRLSACLLACLLVLLSFCLSVCLSVFQVPAFGVSTRKEQTTYINFWIIGTVQTVPISAHCPSDMAHFNLREQRCLSPEWQGHSCLVL